MSLRRAIHFLEEQERVFRQQNGCVRDSPPRGGPCEIRVVTRAGSYHDGFVAVP